MAKVSYDVSGAQVGAQKEYDIATGTVVAEGQFVKLTAGKVVLAVVGETSAILGLAAESHSGAADALNVRSNGLKIKVNDSPSAVYETVAPRATATSGSTTTMAATGLAAFADSDFVGGYIKLVSKVAASTNTDPIGTVYPVTGSTAATKLFTFTKTAGGAVTAGDVFEIYPPIGFAKGNLDAGISKYDLTATASISLRTSGFDTDRGVVYMMANLHQSANKLA